MNQFERALEYRNNGLEVLPLVPNGKKPLIKWKDKPPLTDIELRNYFDGTTNNIGIFCGPISRNLLVLDFDSRRAFNEYRGSISYILNATLATRTRRGYHVYIQTPDELFCNPYDKVQDIDIKFNGYVVAPESKIDNFQYEFFQDSNIYRLQSLEELPFKLKRQEQGQQRQFLCLAKPYGLPNHLFKALKAEIGSYNSRSQAEQALITYCASQGWTFEQVSYLFKRYGTHSTHYKQHSEPEKYLYNSYQNSVKYLQHNHSEFDLLIEKLYQWSTTYQWPGRTGDYDRTIFQALLKIAKRSGKLEIGASIREISQLTGINPVTVSRALQRIQVIRLIGRKNSNIYKICEETDLIQSYKQKIVKDCCILSFREI